MTLAIMSQVRLTAIERESQPEIGDAVGTVHGCGGEWVEIAWPRFRSWHKATQVESVQSQSNTKV